MTTEKQTHANRQNALKSTGPKTPEGKLMAKGNAVKHGILSPAVVIRRGDGQERAEVYQCLHQGLRDNFQPQGIMEEVLVEQIAVTLWRKRRVLRFEAGCIRKQLDDYRESVAQEDELPSIHLKKPASAVQQLEKAKQRLVEHQTDKEILGMGRDILSEEAVKNWADSYFRIAEERGLDSIGSDPHDVRDYLEKQGLTEGQIRQEFVRIAEEGIQEVQEEIKELEAEASLELERVALLGAIPASGLDLDKIIRYEASLDRQLYKAINHLERLQRSRKGESLPLPVVLDES